MQTEHAKPSVFQGHVILDKIPSFFAPYLSSDSFHKMWLNSKYFVLPKSSGGQNKFLIQLFHNMPSKYQIILFYFAVDNVTGTTLSRPHFFISAL